MFLDKLLVGLDLTTMDKRKKKLNPSLLLCANLDKITFIDTIDYV